MDLSLLIPSPLNMLSDSFSTGRGAYFTIYENIKEVRNILRWSSSLFFFLFSFLAFFPSTSHLFSFLFFCSFFSFFAKTVSSFRPLFKKSNKILDFTNTFKSMREKKFHRKEKRMCLRTCLRIFHLLFNHCSRKHRSNGNSMILKWRIVHSRITSYDRLSLSLLFAFCHDFIHGLPLRCYSPSLIKSI